MSCGGGECCKQRITVEACWTLLHEVGIDKMIAAFEAGKPLADDFFNPEDRMMLYTAVYNVCTSYTTDAQTQKLYERYRTTFEDYISAKVLPSLREKSNETLLGEFLRRWKNHRIMTKWLSVFFQYLSRTYIQMKNLPSLLEVSYSTFYKLVYLEMKDRVRYAVTSMINSERVDEAMLKEVLAFCEEIKGGDASKNYAKDMEEAVNEATFKFRSLSL
ncbi:hypothetical protein ACP275_07G015800 [Erythranthe tilingii]